MTSTNFQDLEISREIRISADWEQPTSQIWWQDLDEDPDDKEAWDSCPFQVADSGGNQKEALRLVDEWLDMETQWAS